MYFGHLVYALRSLRRVCNVNLKLLYRAIMQMPEVLQVRYDGRQLAVAFKFGNRYNIGTPDK